MIFLKSLVASLPATIGVVAAPTYLLWQARADPLGGSPLPNALLVYGLAAMIGGVLGMLATLPNLAGAIVANRYSGGVPLTAAALFIGTATAGFAFVMQSVNDLLRSAGAPRHGHDALMWTCFALNLLLCLAITFGRSR